MRVPKKKPKSPSTKLISDLKKSLSLVGTPPLFALKIAVWTVYWLGDQAVKTGLKLIEVVSEIIKTIVWLVRTITEGVEILAGNTNATFISFVRLARLNLIAQIAWLTNGLSLTKTRLKKTRLSIISNFSLPRVPLATVQLFTQKPMPVPVALKRMAFILIGFFLCFLFLVLPLWTKTKIDQLPDPKILTARDIPVSTKIYDRNGILLYSFYGDENRSIVQLEQLPKFIIDATLAIEDKNFYSHPGIDPRGILRALFTNNNGEFSQGGSTITQQLVRSALLSPERTFTRKIKEIILALWTEKIYSKDEILTMYLNQVPYGGAAYGIETAAQTYFGKSAKNLTLAQAALLAGLPSAPSVYSPFGTHPELAKERQRQVLSAMISDGYITSFQAETSEKEELNFASQETGIKAPHFVMFVKDYLSQKYGQRVLEKGGLEVHTTLDYSLYEKTMTILREGVEKQKYLSVGNGAVLITNPKTGEILTMVGSTDFFNLKNDGNVNVTVAQRSPGSSIKPLTYALAFEKGLITPGSILDDSPVAFKNPGGASYVPQNYDNKFHGKVSARIALASSYNIPVLRLIEKLGVTNFLDFAKNAGISSFQDYNRYGLSVTLGGGEVRMTEMAQAYSMFPNNGEAVPLIPVTLVKDYRGRVLEQLDPNQFSLFNLNSHRLISPKTAFLINNILSDDSARAPTFGFGSALVIPSYTVAVKTGTAETKRDNWTIGYTPDLLVVVWVGNNNNAPMSTFLESGNTGAAAIWNPIMKLALEGKPDQAFSRPDDIISVTICALNGLLPCENCPSLRTEFFTRGTEPKTACNFTKEEVEKILHPEEKKN